MLRTFQIVCLTAVFLGLAATAAVADGTPTPPSQADLAKAKAHYARGAELFETKKYEAAVVEFKESYRLSRNPLLLYNIGYTLDQLAIADKAIFYYQKFLDDTPDAAKNRDLATDRIETLRRQLGDDALFATSSAVEPARGTTPEPTEPAPETEPEKPLRKASPSEFKHNVVEEAPPGRPLDITAFIPDDAGWRAVLLYRVSGMRRFEAVPMRPRYNELVARVPAARLRADATLQYYVEARDASNAVIAHSGESSSPHLIVVEVGATAHFYPDFGDGDDGESLASLEPAPAAGATGGGFTDVGSSRFRKLKWGSTGAAIGLLAMSATFYFVAADASSSIEGQSVASDMCPSGPPCKAWSDRQEGLQNRGKRFDTLANVSLGVGLAAAATAGFVWYWEIKHNKKNTRDRDIAAVPVVGDDFLGGAAAWRF